SNGTAPRSRCAGMADTCRNGDEPTDGHLGGLGRVNVQAAGSRSENELLPLTSIVVGKQSGTPGEGIPADPATLDKQREKVYQRDWYDIYPPSEAELSRAHHQRLGELAAKA